MFQSTLIATTILMLNISGGGAGLPVRDAQLSRITILEKALTPHPYAAQLEKMVLGTMGEGTPWGEFRDPEDGRRYVGHDVCRSCHYGQHRTWSETKMGRQAIRTLGDFKRGLFLDDSRCLSCHTTGYDPGRDNGGFDEGVQGMADVQCEACHGAGSLMAEKMDRKYIIRTTDADLCGRCHSERYGTKLCLPEYDEWRISKHRLSLETLKNSPLAEDKCLRCHSADGVAPPSDRPLTLEGASHGVTCQACHHPMARTFPELVDNNQLRRPKMEICQWCHTASEEVPRGIPHSPQAEMFAGTGGIEFPGEEYRNGPMNAEMDRSCLTCHALSDRTVEYPYQGHAFMPIIMACRRCHPDLDGFDRKGVQARIRRLLKVLERKLENCPPGDQEGEYCKIARYNYYFVLKDGSLGIHNSDYARKLLVDSIRFVDRDLTDQPMSP